MIRWGNQGRHGIRHREACQKMWQDGAGLDLGSGRSALRLAAGALLGVWVAAFPVGPGTSTAAQQAEGVVAPAVPIPSPLRQTPAEAASTEPEQAPEPAPGAPDGASPNAELPLSESLGEAVVEPGAEAGEATAQPAAPADPNEAGGEGETDRLPVEDAPTIAPLSDQRLAFEAPASVQTILPGTPQQLLLQAGRALPAGSAWRLLLDNQTGAGLEKILVLQAPGFVGSGLAGPERLTPLAYRIELVNRDGLERADWTLALVGQGAGQGAREGAQVFRLVLPPASRSELIIRPPTNEALGTTSPLLQLWSEPAYGAYLSSRLVLNGVLLGSLFVLFAYAAARFFLAPALPAGLLVGFLGAGLMLLVQASGMILVPSFLGLAALGIALACGLQIIRLEMVKDHQTALSSPPWRFLVLGLTGLAAVPAPAAFAMPEAAGGLGRILLALTLTVVGLMLVQHRKSQKIDLTTQSSRLGLTLRSAGPTAPVFKGAIQASFIAFVLFGLLALVLTTPTLEASAPLLEPLRLGALFLAFGVTGIAFLSEPLHALALYAERLKAEAARQVSAREALLAGQANNSSVDASLTTVRSEKATLQEVNAYALAVSGAQEQLFDWTPEGDVLRLDPALKALVGASAEDVATHAAWLTHIHPEDREIYSQTLRAQLKRGNLPFELSYRVVTPSFSEESDEEAPRPVQAKWLTMRATCLPGDDGFAARCIGLIRDRTGEVIAQETQASGGGEEAATDPLTGLALRPALLVALKEAFGKPLQSDASGVEGGSAQGTVPSLALYVFNLDRFRTVNEGLGHLHGDRLLAAMAERLRAFAQPEDFLARIGSDEFALLRKAPTPESPAAEGLATSAGDDAGDGTTIAEAEYLLETAGDLLRVIGLPLTLAEQEVFPNASLGAARSNAGLKDGPALLKAAQLAMLQAKRTSGSKAVVYEPKMAGKAPLVLSLEADLRRAVERQEIKVLYQPVVNLQTNELAGLEALVRWDHPKRGQLAPDMFVALAEETGMIVPIGRFVLSMACFQMARWQRAYEEAEDLFITVNISSHQLRRSAFEADLGEALAASKLPPEALILEITESTILEAPEETEALLTRIAKLGVRVALDDFGTGFASLSNLQRFAFDLLKIDRSFVARMGQEDGSRAIVEAVVSLAKRLSLPVIAEGAETAGDVDRLKDFGSTFGQGFFYGPPVPAGQITALFQDREQHGGGPLTPLEGDANSPTTPIDIDVDQPAELAPAKSA